MLSLKYSYFSFKLFGALGEGETENDISEHFLNETREQNEVGGLT